MVRYILNNKQWIFSGIGVLFITLLIAAAKYYWVRTRSETVASTSESGRVSAQVLKRYSREQRISVGDFYSFPGGFTPTRVQVLGIERATVKSEFGPPEEEDVARLQIDFAGVFTNGIAGKEVGGSS